MSGNVRGAFCATAHSEHSDSPKEATQWWSSWVGSPSTDAMARVLSQTWIRWLRSPVIIVVRLGTAHQPGSDACCLPIVAPKGCKAEQRDAYHTAAR